MIHKEVIREDGFNRTVISSMYENGDVVVVLQEVTADEEGNETIIREVTNIVFEAGSFEFTQEELAVLRPQQAINNLHIE